MQLLTSAALKFEKDFPGESYFQTLFEVSIYNKLLVTNKSSPTTTTSPHPAPPKYFTEVVAHYTLDIAVQCVILSVRMKHNMIIVHVNISNK